MDSKFEFSRAGRVVALASGGKDFIKYYVDLSCSSVE